MEISNCSFRSYYRNTKFEGQRRNGGLWSESTLEAAYVARGRGSVVCGSDRELVRSVQLHLLDTVMNDAALSGALSGRSGAR